MTYESSGSPSNVSPPVHFYPSIITEDDPGIGRKAERYDED
jgi:hypothetical protein